MAIEKSIDISTHTPSTKCAKPEVDEDVDEADSTASQDDVNHHSIDPHNGLPIDRGWAWMVLAGAAFYLLLFGGIRKNMGIFFVAFQDRFHSSASLTSTLTTLQNFLISVSSLFIMTIGMQYMSNRTAIMIGALCHTTAHIITAFATDISLLFLSVGVLEGFGVALVHPPVTAALGEYFQKRRGFANGIAFSGASCGGLIFAPVMSALFENYGYTGTILIVAGMTFNILVTAALIRPIKSFQTKDDSKYENVNKALLDGEKATDEDHELSNSVSVNKNHVDEDVIKESDEILRQLVLETKNQHTAFIPNKAILQLKMDAPLSLNIVRSDSYTPDNNTSSDKTSSPLLPRARAWSESNRRNRTISAPTHLSHTELSPLNSIVESLSMSRVALYASADGVCGSVIDIQELPVEDKSKVADSTPNWLTKLKASFDIGLFRNPVFPLFLFMAAMLAPSTGLLSAFLAPLARDQGVTSEQVGILMSIVGGVGMVSRISCAFVADRRFIRLTTLLATVATCIGIVAHCIRFFNTFRSLVFVAVMIGLCCELYQAMFAVILVEYLTLPKLKSTIGFTILCHGISTAGTFPVVGTLRDVTGSYYASYHYLGTMSILGAILALLIPHVHNKQNQTSEEDL